MYVKNLVIFLKNYIEMNPFGLNSCLRNGKRITASYLGGSMDPKKYGKIITNINSAPKKSVLSNIIYSHLNICLISDFIVFVSQVLKQTLVDVSYLNFC